MKFNDFNRDLAFSYEASSETFWQAVYRKAFPGIVFALAATGDSQGQRLGIDRVLYLDTGKTLFVDEKKRRRSYGDILLEYKSNSNSRVDDGWINKDLLIDYLAYAFMDTRTVYLFDWQRLKRIWLDNRNDWQRKAHAGVEGFRHVAANNGCYWTYSVAVPISVLNNAISMPVTIKECEINERIFP